MKEIARMRYVVDTVKRNISQLNAKRWKREIINAIIALTVREQISHRKGTQVYGTSVPLSLINRRKLRKQSHTIVKKTTNYKFVNMQNYVLECLVNVK